MPCHDCEETLDVTLNSLALQSVDDFEVVAVDDCSADSTPRILRQWQRRHGWLRVVRNDRNLGIGTTRNVMLDHARGHVVGFIDADDWVAPHYYRNLLRVILETGVDFVRSDHTRVVGRRRTLHVAPEARRGVDLDPASAILPLTRPSMVDYPYSWAGLYRRAFLAERDLRFIDGAYSAEDRLLIWRLHLEGSRYRCVSECGYFYRRDQPTSLTSVGDVRQLGFLAAARGILDYLEERGAPAELRDKAVRQALALIVFHFDRRERLSPDAWRGYLEGSGALLREADPWSRPEVTAGFGDRRLAVIRWLMDPGDPIPEGA